MILVDQNEDSKRNHEKGIHFIADLNRMGVKAESASLDSGDFCFEGNGPEGSIAVGIERKTLHDILMCIDDGHLTSQLLKMKDLYTLRVVIIEGHWKPHDQSMLLMEGFNGGMNFGYCKPNGSRVMYSKLYRYLISVSLSGAIVTYSRDPQHTGVNVAEWFHYFQKRWKDHTSLRELPKVAIPTLNAKPTLTRKWAFAIDSIGEKLSDFATRQFKTPIALATADEAEWLKIPGVGVRTAQQIVREVNGYRR